MERKRLEIKNKSDCTGCRACEKLCSVNCIKMVEDKEGFIFPEIDEEKCIHCGICRDRCPERKERKANQEFTIYGMKSKEISVSQKSTSAGIAYLLSRQVIKNKGVVVGCAYLEKLIPGQIRVDSIEEIEKLRGSKYVFSDTKDTYQEVKQDLAENREVLYLGTPCQIGGLYAFLGKPSPLLYTVDIVCHGVPSSKLFLNYIDDLENKYKEKIIDYQFRNKDKAEWGEFCAKIVLANGKVNYRKADNDPYYSHFLTGTTYRDCCYECQYASMNRVGDITLGDFWGIEQYDSHFYSPQGVSLVICNSEKGKKMIQELEEDTLVKVFEEAQAVRKNANLVRPTKREKIRDTIYEGIDELSSQEYIKKKLKVQMSPKQIIKRIIPKKMKKIVKKWI